MNSDMEIAMDIDDRNVYISTAEVLGETNVEEEVVTEIASEAECTNGTSIANEMIEINLGTEENHFPHL